MAKLTRIPHANLWLEAVDAGAICLSQFLISARLHYLVLHEGFGSSQDVDEGAVTLCHLQQSLCLAFLLIEKCICFLTLMIV